MKYDISIDDNQGEQQDGSTFGFIFAKGYRGFFFSYPGKLGGKTPLTMSVADKVSCIESLEYDEMNSGNNDMDLPLRVAVRELRKYLDKTYDSRRKYPQYGS